MPLSTYLLSSAAIFAPRRVKTSARPATTMPALSPPVSVPREATGQQFSAVDDVLKRQRAKHAAHAAAHAAPQPPPPPSDSVARQLFVSPRDGRAAAPDESDVEKRLQVLDQLAQRLEAEVREQRAARQGVEELLEVERALAASAAEVHAQQLDDQRRRVTEEHGARKRAEDALARCLGERSLQSSRVTEAQSSAQRWEAECGRVAAQSEAELAKFRAVHDQELRRRGDEADQLRELLREWEERQQDTEHHAAAALDQAATEHDALQQALAAKTAQTEAQQSALAAAKASQASAEDRAATAEAGVEAAHEELKERIAFERGERIKLERKNEKLSKALRLERTRRAGCPVCRRNYCGDDGAVAPQDGGSGRPASSGGVSRQQHHLVPTALSEAEARRALGAPGLCVPIRTPWHLLIQPSAAFSEQCACVYLASWQASSWTRRSHRSKQRIGNACWRRTPTRIHRPLRTAARSFSACKQPMQR
jgi:hypothetical protein